MTIPVEVDIELRRLRDENEKLKLALRQAERAYEREAVGRAIEREATAAGVTPSAVPDIVSRALEGGEWRVDDRGALLRYRDGLPDMLPNGGRVSVRGWLKSLREDPKAQHLFGSVPEARADGEQGGQPNPFDKASPHYSVTQQYELARKDPARARQLAAAVDPGLARALDGLR